MEISYFAFIYYVILNILRPCLTTDIVLKNRVKCGPSCVCWEIKKKVFFPYHH